MCPACRQIEGMLQASNGGTIILDIGPSSIGKTILIIKLICCELSFNTVIQWIPQDYLLLLLLLLFVVVCKSTNQKITPSWAGKQKTRRESLSLISEAEKKLSRQKIGKDLKKELKKRLVGGFQPLWKNISQNRNLPQLGVKNKKIFENHQLDDHTLVLPSAPNYPIEKVFFLAPKTNPLQNHLQKGFFGIWDKKTFDSCDLSDVHHPVIQVHIW